MTPFARLLAVASTQHGAVHTSQARSAGLSAKAQARLVARGELLRPGRRVLVVAGAPRTIRQRAMTATLDASPGAFTNSTTAVALWGLPGFDVRPVHLVRPEGIGRARTSLAIVHEVLDLLPHHVTALDGIPIVRPERAIFELCGSQHPQRAERALDNAWSRGLLSGDSLRRVHRELAERGRAGTVVLRELLDARPPGYIPPASNLERRFEQIVDRHRLGPMERQVDTGSDEMWVGRVDFRHCHYPVIAEIQSERYHAALCDRRADEARIAALEAAGYVVKQFWDTEVWYRPDLVAERLRSALAGFAGRFGPIRA